MVINKKCSILVTSCDAYEDAWYPFFKLFNIMWPDCKYPVFLNTETKKYNCEYLEVNELHPKSTQLKIGKQISWSKRLKEVVEQIDSKYLLFFLEDFFLMSPVRSDVVEKCIDYMDKNDDVAIIDFYREPHDNQVVLEEFSYTSRSFDYAINAMAALWRKDFLLNIIRDENPWDFEFFGTRRWWKTDYKILTHKEEFPPVFDYKIKPALGYGIFQGKWLRNNLELFSKYNISVDFEKRGFTDPPNMVARERENHWLLNDIKKVVTHPSQFRHYVKCFNNVFADKKRRFKAKYFNR